MVVKKTELKKTELKDTELNSIFLRLEQAVNDTEIEEKAKCDIMLGVTAIVTECVKNPPSFEDGKAIHEYCLPYALRYADLDDSPLIKAMTDLFLR